MISQRLWGGGGQTGTRKTLSECGKSEKRSNSKNLSKRMKNKSFCKNWKFSVRTFFFSCLNPSMFFVFYKTTHHVISNKTNECTHEQLNIWTTNTFTAHLTWNRVLKGSKWCLKASQLMETISEHTSGRCLIQTLNFDLNWPRPGPYSDLPVWQVYFWYSPAATTLPRKISGSTMIAMCVRVC